MNENQIDKTNSIGRVICQVRKFRKISRIELATKLNYSPNTIKQIELGNSNPSFKTLIELSLALGVEPYVLLYLSSSIRKNPPTDADKNQQMYYFNASFMEHLKNIYGVTLNEL
jgi:transcriptional regulator with XRE-family HTH domain